MSKSGWVLANPDDTERAGRAFASALEKGDVVGLIGPLGAGKTSFVRAVITELRSQMIAPDADSVTSPTYALINRYIGPPGLQTIIHADLYRLNGLDDLESTGYWDEIVGADLTFVEWIDNIPGAWPGPGIEVNIHREGEGRRIQIDAHGGLKPSRHAALTQALTRELGEPKR